MELKYTGGLQGIWFQIDAILISFKAFGMKLMLYWWAVKHLVSFPCSYLCHFVFYDLFSVLVYFLFCVLRVFIRLVSFFLLCCYFVGRSVCMYACSCGIYVFHQLYFSFLMFVLFVMSFMISLDLLC